MAQAIDKALDAHLSGEPLQWGSAVEKMVGSNSPVRIYKSDQGSIVLSLFRGGWPPVSLMNSLVWLGLA